RSARKRIENVMRHRQWALALTGIALVASGALVATADTSGPASDVAAWAREETPRSTTFIVPPALDSFRVPARRGVVTTWKAVPFRADLAADWWTRLTAIAPLDSPPTGISGRDLAAAFARGYLRMSDGDRQRLGETYRAAYAVLPLGAETELPVVFEGRRWKAVQLSP
ncbi:MAG: DUF6798 domain-containing protein, partial [Bacteroidota bacterium]